VDGSTNIIPKMGLTSLRQGYRKILNQIYEPSVYYARVLTFLREYQPTEVRFQLEPQYVLALIRSIHQLASGASSVCTIGGSFSGRCSGNLGYSHLRSRSPSMASISAEWLSYTLYKGVHNNGRQDK